MFTITSNTWKKRESKKPHVAVVVLSYNTADITRQAIETLLRSRDVRLSIFVVDNASTDRSSVSLARKYRLRKNHELLATVDQKKQDTNVLDVFENIHQDFSEISNIRSFSQSDHELHLIELRNNLGFGRANNIATVLTDAPFIFFLNSDAFVKAKTIATLVKSFEESNFTQKSSVLRRSTNVIDNVGIAAAQLFNQDKSLQVQGGSLPNLLTIARWITFLDDLPFVNHFLSSYQHHEVQMRALRQKKIAKVGWVGGTAMMISRACLDEIGGFDPNIFMYGEDVELCWRANHRHWDVILVDAGQVIHLGSASSDHKHAIVGEINGLLYLWYKHASSFDLWCLRQILRFGIRLRIIVFGILRRYGRQRAYQEALELV